MRVALDPRIPVDYFAGFGLLRMLVDRDPTATLRHVPGELGVAPPSTELVSPCVDARTLTARVVRDAKALAKSPLFNHDHASLYVPPGEAARIEAATRPNGPNSTRQWEIWRSWVAPGTRASNGGTQVTPLHLITGQQQWFTMLAACRRHVTPDAVKACLAGAETPGAGVPELRWDTRADFRPYALRAENPSKSKIYGRPVTQWLAAVGLWPYRCWADQRGLRTDGIIFAGPDRTLLRPTWERRSVTVEEVRAEIATATDIDQFDGWYDLIEYQGQGYGTFSPPAPSRLRAFPAS
jgi:hypothetical protein